MRKAEEKNLTQRREDAKIKAWRLGGLSEAGVRILKEGEKIRVIGYRLSVIGYRLSGSG